MKFINIILLVVLLNFTWNNFNSGMEISENVHVDLQAGLKNIISDYIGEVLPAADDITFHKFWSEALNQDKIKASFIYSFRDMDKAGETTTKIQGYAILNKDVEDAPPGKVGVEYWSFDELYILNQNIEFKEGLAISVDNN